VLQAIDLRTGKTVDAMNAPRGPRYRCPLCNAQVHVRRGQWRDAHFAHNPGEGSEDCEEFHPSDGTWNPPETAPQYPVAPKYKVASTESEMETPVWDKPELYIQNYNSHYSLAIILGISRNVKQWTGVVIHKDAAIGVKRLTSDHFKSRNVMRVSPSLEKYVFSKEGDVDEFIWNTLSAGVSPLRGSVNVFRWSDSSGRRLRRQERMVWGEKYWVLVDPSYSIEPLVKNELIDLGRIGLWLLYEVELPTAELVEGWEIYRRHAWEDSFGHGIRSPGTQLWITRPFPTHVESDVWVFPTAGDFEVSATGNTADKIFILSEDGSKRELEHARDQLVWSVTGLAPGLHAIYLDKAPVLTFQISTSSPSLLSPAPCWLVWDGSRMPLFSAESELINLRSKRRALGQLTLEISKHGSFPPITFNDKTWDGSDLASVFNDGSKSFALEAGSFGRVCLEAELAPESSEIAQETLNKAAWLLSLPEPTQSIACIRYPASLSKTCSMLEVQLSKKIWGAEYGPHVYYVWNEINGGCK
jgi:hypothetical protein